MTRAVTFSLGLLSGIGIAGPLSAAETVQPAAAVRVWPAGDGAWNASARWTPVGLPQLADDVRIDGISRVKIVSGEAQAGIVRLGTVRGGDSQLVVARDAVLTLQSMPFDKGDREGTALSLGEVAGAQGEVIVAGQSRTTGKLAVGQSGRGVLRIERGGLVANRIVTLAVNEGSSGEIVVDGVLENENAFDIGHLGTARLLIGPEGVMRYGTRWGVIGSVPPGRGYLEVAGRLEGGAGSDLIVGNAGEGTLALRAGGVVIGRRGSLAQLAAGRGHATVTGEWKMSGELFVGTDGDGALAIEPSGVVRSEAGYLGFNPGAHGTAQIAGLWDCTGDLHVGEFGPGELTLLAGGHLRSGAGSLASQKEISAGGRIAGHWEIRDNLMVGERGRADLAVASGGKISVGGDLFIGALMGAEGRVSIAGELRATGEVNIGYAAAGTLQIARGGRVEGERAHLGRLTTGSGSLEIAGDLTLRDRLDIGREGKGALTVEEEGNLQSGSAILGEKAGAEARATIKGCWRVDELVVGQAGNGLLAIPRGSVIARHVTVGEGSSVLISAGTLEGDVAFDGGTLVVRGAANLGVSVALDRAAAPVRFGAGSAFLLEPSASLALAVRPARPWAAGVYRVMVFAENVTRTGVTADIFRLTAELPATLRGHFELTASALNLVVVAK